MRYCPVDKNEYYNNIWKKELEILSSFFLVNVDVSRDDAVGKFLVG